MAARLAIEAQRERDALQARVEEAEQHVKRLEITVTLLDKELGEA